MVGMTFLWRSYVTTWYLFQTQDQSSEVTDLYPQALGLYGTWLAESKSENPNTIIEKYLEKVNGKLRWAAWATTSAMPRETPSQKWIYVLPGKFAIA